jgi:hypothetical protein
MTPTHELSTLKTDGCTNGDRVRLLNLGLSRMLS